MFRFAKKLCGLQRFLFVADTNQVNAGFLCTSNVLLRRRRINEANPGLEKRLNLFREDVDENVAYDAAVTIDEDGLQSDVKFKERNDRSKNYRQMEQDRERLKRDIVKQKYFKSEKQPNFLTWAEKEQIRQLHSSDPVEWSIEKLTQSFPATETVIKKIIKSCWVQEDLNRISRHDKSVQRNWKELLRGQLELDPQIKEHLLKFAKRNQAGLAHTFLKNSNYCENVLVPVENVEGEFSNMIKLCRGERGGTKQLKIPAFSGQQVDDTNSKELSFRSRSYDSDTFLLDLDSEKPQKVSKLVTLTQYKQAFNLDGIDVEDSVSDISHANVDQGKLKLKANESQKVLGTENVGMSIHQQYPERITIPKSKWKEGGTYKAGDCYYDDDGEFLYRVPGMK